MSTVHGPSSSGTVTAVSDWIARNDARRPLRRPIDMDGLRHVAATLEEVVADPAPWRRRRRPVRSLRPRRTARRAVLAGGVGA
jgi:hypothetical protein